MQAACTAARKGHRVTLFETGDQLGGQFIAAAYPPNKGELATYTAWLCQELRETGVEIRLSCTLSAELIRTERPDAVIVATGGSPLRPPIPGLDRTIVVTAEDVLLGKALCGGRVVVLGGGLVGAETAAHLSFLNHDVTIVEMASKIAADMKVLPSRKELLRMLNAQHVCCRLDTKAVEVLEYGVVVEFDRKREIIYADSIVLALGYRSNGSLLSEISSLCDRTIVVGSAAKVGNALSASREGFFAGYMI